MAIVRVGERRPQDRDEPDGQDQERERQPRVGQPHDQPGRGRRGRSRRRGRAARRRRSRAGSRRRPPASRCGCPRRRAREMSRPRSSVPNGCAAARRLADLLPVRLHRIGRRDPRCADRRDDEEEHDHRAQHRAPAGGGACRHAALGVPGSVDDAGASTAVVAVVLGLTERASDADAGIQQRVGHVDQEVDQHVGRWR